MRAIITMMLVLFCSMAFSQTYTFQRNDFRLEILRGTQIRSSMLLEDVRWVERNAGETISIFDGVHSFSINDEQIGNYASNQIDSLIIDLEAWRLLAITRVSGDTLFIGNDTLITGAGGAQNVAFGIACSDLTTDLAVNTSQGFFHAPYAFTLTEVRAQVLTAPVGSTIEVDINEGGVSVLSTVISIDASEKTSETAATPAVISDAAIADDGIITIDIDQIGASTAGAGLVVWLIGTKP